MKLLRYGPEGSEKPGLLDKNGQIRCLSKFLPDIDGSALTKETIDRLKALELDNLQLISPDVRIGACVNNIGKFLCIGLNFADHAAESGMAIPSEPIVFPSLPALFVVRMMISSNQKAVLNWIGK